MLINRLDLITELNKYFNSIYLYRVFYYYTDDSFLSIYLFPKENTSNSQPLLFQLPLIVLDSTIIDISSTYSSFLQLWSTSAPPTIEYDLTDIIDILNKLQIYFAPDHNSLIYWDEPSLLWKTATIAQVLSKVSSDALPEGTLNKYFSTSAFNTALASSSLGALNDVTLTNPTEGDILQYTNGQLVNTPLTLIQSNNSSSTLLNGNNVLTKVRRLSITQNLQLYNTDATYQFINPLNSNLKVSLPASPLTGATFIIKNLSPATALNIAESSGNVIETLVDPLVQLQLIYDGVEWHGWG
jgi:hypothetical protein